MVSSSSAQSRALAMTKVTPVEVVTDRAAVYPSVLDELLPAAQHSTERYRNNRIESDHADSNGGSGRCVD